MVFFFQFVLFMNRRGRGTRSAIEDFPNFSEEDILREGLSDECRARFEHAFFRDDIRGISAYEKHLDPALLLFNFFVDR